MLFDAPRCAILFEGGYRLMARSYTHDERVPISQLKIVKADVIKTR